jgi:hypothetical protein
MLTRTELVQIISECLDSINLERTSDEKVEVSEETLLLDEQSSLDSLEFVTFSTDLERRLTKATGRRLALAADALASDSHPFRSVRTLTDHLASRLT